MNQSDNSQPDKSVSNDASASAQVLELADEFLERYRRGDRPSLAEYIARYPAVADEIRQVFPAVALLENVALDDPGTESSPPPGPDLDAIRDFIGDFRIIRLIGRGGMGIVYEAEQTSLRRQVALKVLPQQLLLRPNFRKRFQREAQAAARLHHTNIVPVFGVGEEDGLHYYVMQFINGQGLDEVLTEVKNLRQRSVATRRDVAAVTAGHGEQDATVTVTSLADSLLSGWFEANQTPPNVDEPREGNLANHASSRDAGVPTHRAETSVNTSSSVEGRPGTLSHPANSGITTGSRCSYWQSVAHIGMQVADALQYAHEQNILHRDIKPSNLLLDNHGTAWVTDFGLALTDDEQNLTATGDVLGTLRYMAPEQFRGNSDARSDVRALGLTLYEMAALRPAYDAKDRYDLIRQLTETDPPRLESLDPQVPRDLSTIVHKAIARDPSDRYATAGDLHEDLRRFLAFEPIQARRLSNVERSWRWCRRNPGLSMLGAAVGVLLLMLSIGGVTWALHAEADRRQITIAQKAERTAKEGSLARLRGALIEQARAGRWSGQVGRRYLGLEALSEAAAIEPGLDVRNEVAACLALPDIHEVARWQCLAHEDLWAEFTPDLNRYFVQQPGGGPFELYRVTDRPVGRLPIDEGTPVIGPWELKPTTNGLLVASYWKKDSNVSFVVWDWEQGNVKVRTTGLLESHPSFSRDGQLAATLLSSGEIGVFELDSGRELQRLPTDRKNYDTSGAYLHPIRSWLATADNRRQRVEVWDYEVGELLTTFDLAGWCCVCVWSNDGRFLIAAEGENIAVWDVAQRRRITTLKGHQHRVVTLKYHPHQDLLFSSSWDRMTRMWDPLSGRLHVKVPGYLLQLSDDGTRAAFRDRLDLGLWEIADGGECRPLHGTDAAAGTYWTTAAFAPDEQWLAVGSDAGLVIWDLYAGHEVRSLPIGATYSVLLDPAGKNLVTSGVYGILKWPLRHASSHEVVIGPPRHVFEPAAGLAAFVGDRDTLVAKKVGEHAYCVLDFATGETKQSITRRFAADHAVSGDGKWLACGNKYGNEVSVWDTASWKLVTTLPSNGDARPWFSPCNRWLLIGDSDSYEFLAQGTWEVVHTISRDADAGQRIRAAFDPAGDKVAVIREGYKVQLLETATWRELAILEPGDNDWVHGLVFSRLGNRLIVLGAGRMVHVWDLLRIRQGLSDRQLDWDSDIQSLAPSAPVPVFRSSLRLNVDYGDPSRLPEDSAIRAAAEQSQLDHRSE